MEKVAVKLEKLEAFYEEINTLIDGCSFYEQKLNEEFVMKAIGQLEDLYSTGLFNKHLLDEVIHLLYPEDMHPIATYKELVELIHPAQEVSILVANQIQESYDFLVESTEAHLFELKYKLEKVLYV